MSQARMRVFRRCTSRCDQNIFTLQYHVRLSRCPNNLHRQLLDRFILTSSGIIQASLQTYTNLGLDLYARNQ